MSIDNIDKNDSKALTEKEIQIQEAELKLAKQKLELEKQKSSTETKTKTKIDEIKEKFRKGAIKLALGSTIGGVAITALSALSGSDKNSTKEAINESIETLTDDKKSTLEKFLSFISNITKLWNGDDENKNEDKKNVDKSINLRKEYSGNGSLLDMALYLIGKNESSNGTNVLNINDGGAISFGIFQFQKEYLQGFIETLNNSKPKQATKLNELIKKIKIYKNQKSIPAEELKNLKNEAIEISNTCKHEQLAYMRDVIVPNSISSVTESLPSFLKNNRSDITTVMILNIVHQFGTKNRKNIIIKAGENITTEEEFQENLIKIAPTFVNQGDTKKDKTKAEIIKKVMIKRLKELHNLKNTKRNSVKIEQNAEYKIPKNVLTNKNALIQKYNIETPNKRLISIADYHNNTLWIFNHGQVISFPMAGSKKEKGNGEGLGTKENSHKTPTGDFKLSVKNNTNDPSAIAGANGQANIIGATIHMDGLDTNNKNTRSRNILTHGWKIFDKNNNLTRSTGCIHLSGEDSVKYANLIQKEIDNNKNVYMKIMS